MPGRVQDKVALLSGAGSVGDGWGNGKAAAVLYAREGARIFAVDVSQAALRETCDIIRSEGGQVVEHVCDMTDSTQVAGAVQACLEAYGRIDILHNNVGGSAPGGPVDMSEADWDRQMDLNLRTVFLACKHALPAMEAAGRGVIVNISSVAGMRYLSRAMVGYAASKAGLVQFTRNVALQYADKGIRANCVVPGLMNTPLVSHRIADQYGDGDAAKMIADRDAMCPMGHMGDAWDVAYAALYLASDEAGYVTGTEIIVDGGLTVRAV
jgi:NAD(P)-dependent dehydrogenase (short-subunit alcohol dehydrogenase family)